MYTIQTPAHFPADSWWIVHFKAIMMISSLLLSTKTLEFFRFTAENVPLVWLWFVAAVFILTMPFFLQQLNLLKAKQKALVEQIEKEKIQSNKGSSYKLLVEQAKLKQATSKVSLWFSALCSALSNTLSSEETWFGCRGKTLCVVIVNGCNFILIDGCF